MRIVYLKLEIVKKIADIILKLDKDKARKRQLLNLQNEKLKLYDISKAIEEFLVLYKS